MPHPFDCMSEELNLGVADPVTGILTKKILVLITLGLENLGHPVVGFHPVMHAIAHDVWVKEVIIPHRKKETDGFLGRVRDQFVVKVPSTPRGFRIEGPLLVHEGAGSGQDSAVKIGPVPSHDEGGGKVVKKNGSRLIEFYGSSSQTALNKHYGGLSNYRSSEGKKVQLKYRGKIKETVLNILGGLRSSCTYVGAPSLKQLSKCTTFVRVNQQYNDTFE